MTDKTLREYIDFLRKHGFATEASYYNNTVVKIVSVSTGFTLDQVLDLPTKKVIEALIKAKDLIESIEPAKKEYDVELTR